MARSFALARPCARAGTPLPAAARAPARAPARESHVHAGLRACAGPRTLSQAACAIRPVSSERGRSSPVCRGPMRAIHSRARMCRKDGSRSRVSTQSCPRMKIDEESAVRTRTLSASEGVRRRRGRGRSALQYVRLKSHIIGAQTHVPLAMLALAPAARRLARRRPHVSAWQTGALRRGDPCQA